MFNRETQKNWMKSQVAHSLRGRLRLRVEGLNFLNDEKEEIAQMLANLPGVQCVQVTPITCGILLRFDPTATDTSILCEGVDVTMARYAMNAYRNRQAGSKPEEPEVSMTTKQLTKRLALNAGAVVLGHTILPGSLLGGAMASFTSLEALTSLGTDDADGTERGGGSAPRYAPERRFPDGYVDCRKPAARYAAFRPDDSGAV